MTLGELRHLIAGLPDELIVEIGFENHGDDVRSVRVDDTHVVFSQYEAES